MKITLGAVFGASMLLAGHASALSADLNSDFSIANSNPNGAWTYGFATTLGGTLTPFSSSTSGSFDIWYTPGLSSDFTPSVFKNKSGGTINGVLDGEVGLHSGPNGEIAVARYTSSESSVVTISGAFGEGDIGSVGTFIFVDGVQKFGVASTTSAQSFLLSETLNVGSTVDFVVTGDGPYVFDSTPLSASIESVPEPATMGILAIAGLAAASRRRK